MRLGMSLFSFQLDLIIFWRFLFLWTSFGKTTIEMPTSSSEWHIRRCPNTESRGVIKPRPKSTGLPWNFSFLFACLYKDFFFIFVFLENEDEKKKKKGLWNSSGLVSWITPSSIYTQRHTPQEVWWTGLTFSVLDSFLCSPNLVRFLHVVKTDKQHIFDLERAFSAVDKSGVVIAFFSNWRRSSIRRGFLIYLRKRQTGHSYEWVKGYQLQKEWSFAETYQIIQGYICGRTLRIDFV